MPQPGIGGAGGWLAMTVLARWAVAAWEFVVGDDWRTALGVVLALGVVAALAAAGAPAWWVMPSAVLLLLGRSLRRAVASATSRSARPGHAVSSGAPRPGRVMQSAERTTARS